MANYPRYFMMRFSITNAKVDDILGNFDGHWDVDVDSFDALDNAIDKAVKLIRKYRGNIDITYSENVPGTVGMDYGRAIGRYDYQHDKPCFDTVLWSENGISRDYEEMIPLTRNNVKSFTLECVRRFREA